MCTWCFGRLLLAVFRVRRATLRSQLLRNKAHQDDKQAYEAERLRQIAALSSVDDIDEDQAIDFCSVTPDPPVLAPFKANRWLISKTYLLAKASAAVRTVTANLHRRSASAARPSMAGEGGPRPSLHLETAVAEGPLGFLQHDIATTSRFGRLQEPSNAALNAQSIDTAAIPRSITFSPEKRASFSDSRVLSPLPDRNTLSRATDRTRTSQGDEHRPSFASCVSSSSSDGRTSLDHGHVGSYLTGGIQLYLPSNPAIQRGGYHSASLGKREARKAGIRVGGHLASCVLSWMLVIPFLAYKVHDAESQAPCATAILAALAVCLWVTVLRRPENGTDVDCSGGPLLAIQTIMAEGFWYKNDRAPPMASSSAVAFEHLASRPVTPFPMPLSAQTDAVSSGGLSSGQPISPVPPMSAVSGTSNTDIGNHFASRAASRAGSHHRSTGSNNSTSAASLTSFAAFSQPPQGIVRHSLDTTEAPTNIFARALHMAAPHPKLQVISRGAGGHAPRQSEEIAKPETPDGDWLKKEAQKLKSINMTKQQSASVICDIGNEKAGDMIEANDKGPTFPGDTVASRTDSMHSTGSVFEKVERRRSTL